jgi:UDP-2,3-diacylglucosamine pyrophosphatase LpxH
MTRICYVCLSDLHLGADNSLLTHLTPNGSKGRNPANVDPSKPSRVLRELAASLQALLRPEAGEPKATLILNGDLLELAFSQDNLAIMAFERLLELLFPERGEPLVDSKIVFIPGNHDHHLWETAREMQYAKYVQRHPPGDALKAPWHATAMFSPKHASATLLNGVAQRYPHMSEAGVEILTVYPNYALMNKETKCLIFSHGHFTESIYMLMSTLANLLYPHRKDKPKATWDAEAENFAWIDFFWSTLGRSGAAGKDVEHLYEMLLVPRRKEVLAKQLAGIVGHELLGGAGGLLAFLLRPIIGGLLARAGGLEKTRTGKPLSDDARKGLGFFLERLVRGQFLAERDVELEGAAKEVTFIFGHTHKPFSAKMDFKGFPPKVSVYNTGGWVVDSEKPDVSHGGAIVLVDDDLNAVCVRMYNETKDGRAQAVRVEVAEPASGSNALFEYVSSTVDSNAKPWSTFAAAIAEALPAYYENFRWNLTRGG